MNEQKLKQGDKVICISDYENHWGSCDSIKDNLIIGDVYTIDKISIHSWHTRLYLKEFPNKKFNSVHFKNCKLF